MEKEILKMRDEMMKSEKQKHELREKIKFWKSKSDAFENEKDFLYKQTMETKKKNKLLKIALGKLQSEMDKLLTSQDQKQKMDGEI